METEPIAPQFQSMSFNSSSSPSFQPFAQHFNEQERQHLMMLQQQQQQQQQQQALLNQHQAVASQQDEEMEMADDTTSDMKYSENDMNQMNITMNSMSQNAHSTNVNTLGSTLHNNNKSQQEQQFLQQIHNQQQQQQQQQQKFGRLASDFVKKDNQKQLEDEESYDEDDDDYDEDEDDLDDYDEHLVHEMMLSAAPEVQNIIKLIVSGFTACATETIRYLVEEENLTENSPIMASLIEHLKTQETMLIVNCLKTQQYQAQLIKQHQQQILANQLLSKQIDPKNIDPKLLNQLNAQAAMVAQQQNLHHHQQLHQQAQLKAAAVVAAQQQQQQQQQHQQQQHQQQQQKKINHQNSHHKSHPISSPIQSNNQSSIPNLNSVTNGSLSPPICANGPLTSSPINKPFDHSSNSINNVNSLNHPVSNFNHTLHAFGGSHSSLSPSSCSSLHSNVNSQNSSAHNSQSSSPIHTPPLHSFHNANVNQMQQTNPFSNVNSFANAGNTGGSTFFNNQTSGVLSTSSFKTPFNDSGFSE